MKHIDVQCLLSIKMINQTQAAEQNSRTHFPRAFVLYIWYLWLLLYMTLAFMELFTKVSSPNVQKTHVRDYRTQRLDNA